MRTGAQNVQHYAIPVPAIAAPRKCITVSNSKDRCSSLSEALRGASSLLALLVIRARSLSRMPWGRKVFLTRQIGPWVSMETTF